MKEQKAAFINYCQVQKATCKYNHHRKLKNYAPVDRFLYLIDALYLFLPRHPPSVCIITVLFNLLLIHYQQIIVLILTLKLLLLFFRQAQIATQMYRPQAWIGRAKQDWAKTVGIRILRSTDFATICKHLRWNLYDMKVVISLSIEDLTQRD